VILSLLLFFLSLSAMLGCSIVLHPSRDVGCFGAKAGPGFPAFFSDGLAGRSSSGCCPT
jgi:hypothetical protein